MSTAGWIILAVLLLPMIGFLIWWIILMSVVRIPSGSLGLLMVKGKGHRHRPASRFTLPARPATPDGRGIPLGRTGLPGR
ncbi:MAG TPA: hypothetical protein VFC16_03665 [Nakamurella sp.]|jgi:hypothetical protein|nr:hypothetical protein [Nakamurella sp.]